VPVTESATRPESRLWLWDQVRVPSRLPAHSRRATARVKGTPSRRRVRPSAPRVCPARRNSLAVWGAFLKGRGRSIPRDREVLGGFWVPGVGAGRRHRRGRGQDSPGGRPVGLGLDVGSGWRRLVCPRGSPGWLWWAALSPLSDMDGRRSREPGRRAFLRHRRWVAWSSTAAASRGQSTSRPRPVPGGHTPRDLAGWLRRVRPHAGRGRLRMCPSRSP
jgi:hypothetical protein